MAKKKWGGTFFERLVCDLNKVRNEYEKEITYMIHHMVQTQLYGHEPQWDCRTLKDKVYAIMEQITMAEYLDMEWLADQCQEISDEIREDLIQNQNYPCCGGSGCISCLAGGWSNFK